MKIKKILNNNAILVGQGTKTFIWIGTGIGFRKKPGDEAEDSKIERVFVLKKQSTDRFMLLLENIPIEYAAIADDVINYGKKQISYELSDVIYISLTDHLFNTIKLKKEGLTINNQIFWEIQKFYPIEFSIGKYAVNLINKEDEINLDESEACNVAMHFINAQINNGEYMENINLLTKKIRDIISIVRIHNRVEVNEKSLSFERFVTHLRFFFKRLENDNSEKEDIGNPLLVHVIEKYPKAYETTLLIGEYLQRTLYDNEQLYLTLHVQKLIEINVN
nr:PRD domain-containing protein [Carnobacterium maltaromaticum]